MYEIISMINILSFHPNSYWGTLISKRRALGNIEIVTNELFSFLALLHLVQM